MAYSDAVYEKANNELTRRRQNAEYVFEQHREEIEKKYPQYIELALSLAGASSEIINTVTNAKGNKEIIKKQMDSLRDKNLKVQEEIQHLLKQGGYPADYLEIKYTCSLCNDSGIYDNHRCSCMRDLLRKYSFEDLSANSPLRLSSFDTFDLNYYSKETVNNTCDYIQMQKIFDYCKEYALEFDTKNPDLLLMGETGLGKTHLSLAIAGEAIRRGYNVVYDSAQNLFAQLEDEKFNRNDGTTAELLNSADLLIIDDVGAEFSTQFTIAAFYNIVNTRNLRSLPTIISTNLTFTELEKKYTRRITSRLLGNYITLKFCGSDIRQLKRLENGYY
ncbi:MAG TPA: ATP-binding protein [Clostridiales bacterium]|jgi:DNA replication protein DnaC|nr:ATP-binding protein [Clostridiales bacterium]